MSQPLPHRSAVVLSWADAGPYAPPSRSAVELRFATDVPTAIGFRGTSFGTPVAALSRTAEAHGFVSTAVGSPESTATVSGRASGWLTTAFGLGEVAYTDPTTSAATAINSTAFGDPSATQYSLAATAGIATVFGTPSWPRPIAAAASGSLRSKYGAPIAYNLPTTATPRVTDAIGNSGTCFGAATVANYAGSASTGAQFGPVAARASAHAAGSTFGAVGQPTAGATVHGLGILSLGMGDPSALRTQPAEGRQTGRFGQPSSARRRFNHPAFGSSSSQFGAPAATQQYDALHLAPTTRFGRPQRARSTEC